MTTEIDDAIEALHKERHARAAGRKARDERERSQKAPTSLFGAGRAESQAKRFQWGAESAGDILALIECVTERGGAIRFGYSRDGHAGSIGIYYGDSRDTLWVNPEEGSAIIFEKIHRVMGQFDECDGKAPAST